METVKRISPLVRSAAHYETSLEVLRQISESGTVAKSGIMVGLGRLRMKWQRSWTTCATQVAGYSLSDNICNLRISIIP